MERRRTRPAAVCVAAMVLWTVLVRAHAPDVDLWRAVVWWWMGG